MNAHPVAPALVALLRSRNEHVAFAESCTAGQCSAFLGSVPGASNCLSGGIVSYTAGAKRSLLDVCDETIDEFTTESQEVADQMAEGLFDRFPVADWCVSVVGHLGPDAPAEKDGRVWISIAYWSYIHADGSVMILHRSVHKLPQTDRRERQIAAADLVLLELDKLIRSTASPLAMDQP